LPLIGFDAKQDVASVVPKDNQVFAGTINGSGTLNVQVTRRSEDSTLARFVKLIAEAKTQRSPSQRLTEVFERRYVPAVLVLVFMLLFAFLVVDETFKQSLYRAMAVLVAASPCALAISTPSAVLSAIARAGREGLLIKGGGPLEQLGQVAVIAFDKTGTLTTGRPEVVDVFTMPDVTRDELIATAAIVQRMSDHPLAQAIVRADRSERDRALDGSLSVTDMHRIAGQGVVANLGSERVSIGNAKMFAGPANTPQPLPVEIAEAEKALRHHGRTIAIVQRGDRFLGVIGLVDTPRPGAAKTVQKLREMGLERLVMLSGDHREAAQAIADVLSLDEAKGDLLPADKVAEVTAMSATHATAMVGDGANDAPAMAAASVSIAMGAAGSDVALQTADIALMGDDLSKLPFAIGLGKAAGRIIRQNLWLSLGTIAFLVPATMLGFKLGPAVVLHEGSTVVVVANALRLLRYRMPK
jgi:Zn2+/Cd2+-exporting ATPase